MIWAVFVFVLIIVAFIYYKYITSYEKKASKLIRFYREVVKELPSTTHPSSLWKEVVKKYGKLFGWSENMQQEFFDFKSKTDPSLLNSPGVTSWATEIIYYEVLDKATNSKSGDVSKKMSRLPYEYARIQKACQDEYMTVMKIHKIS